MACQSQSAGESSIFLITNLHSTYAAHLYVDSNCININRTDNNHLDLCDYQDWTCLLHTVYQNVHGDRHLSVRDDKIICEKTVEMGTVSISLQSPSIFVPRYLQRERRC